MIQSGYRGRIAPSPTGLLHLGHARTFWTAFKRARQAGGTLIFRNEDLDPQRSQPEFVQAMIQDLHWLGIRWQEGPAADENGVAAAGEIGPHAPYSQSQRIDFYRGAWRELLERGWLYPCTCSRRELSQSANAPHNDDHEPIYPGTCRRILSAEEIAEVIAAAGETGPALGVNWRFRVPDLETVEFTDRNPIFGHRTYVAGRDFGDFLLWRRDGVPAYQLAVVVDDAAMEITEVVRGADLLLSTARQRLLQRALGLAMPQTFHCELVTGDDGKRLAKRSNGVSLRVMREQGWAPEDVRAAFRDSARGSYI
jgi:glutamyl/glutaminyl-tRNA synthetase